MLRPSVHFRPHEDPVSTELDASYVLMVAEDRYEVVLGEQTTRAPLSAAWFARAAHGRQAADPGNRVSNRGAARLSRARRSVEPRLFPCRASPRIADATLVASTDAWECASALDPAGRDRRGTGTRGAACCSRRRDKTAGSNGIVSELILAADQFLITPAGRVQDVARARAVGDEVRTLIAGYHWFTDWGRDAMISLEGITLTTGPLQRSGMDSQNLLALHPRRPDPESVSRRERTKACITPRTRRSGISTPSIVTPR